MGYKNYINMELIKTLSWGNVLVSYQYITYGQWHPTDKETLIMNLLNVPTAVHPKGMEPTTLLIINLALQSDMDA